MITDSLPRAWLAAAVGAVLLTSCARRDDAPALAVADHGLTLTAAQRERIHLDTVASSPFRRTIETTGTVEFDSDHATTVLAPISGPATRLLVSLGAQVRPGDALAVVESPDFAAAVSAYRKAVATARNSRRVADLDEKLFAGDAIARRDMEQAETDATNAEADRDAALQQLRALGVDAGVIADLEQNRPVANLTGTIRAPIAGEVVEKLITPGQLLQAGATPCFTIADLSHVWVLANLFESDLSAVATGQTAEILTPAVPQRFPGVIDNISALIDPNTRAVAVRIVAANPDGILKKQMYVRVLIHSTQDRAGLLVPVSAVLRDHDNLPFVYVRRPDGGFDRRRVVLGDRVDERYDITSGLAAGEQIVVEGGVFLQFQENQ